jgi:hypothetical protein
MSSEDWLLLHLRVTAEAHPGALARVLDRFQNLNIVPRRVVAEWAGSGTVHIEVQVAGLGEDALDVIAAKLSQVPCIQNAYWHR